MIDTRYSTTIIEPLKRLADRLEALINDKNNPQLLLHWFDPEVIRSAAAELQANNERIRRLNTMIDALLARETKELDAIAKEKLER